MGDPDSPIPAFIVNPIKVDDVDTTREKITAMCADHGWSEPLWFETTKDDPGVGQTEIALKHEADVVVAMGGDGTVRAVASKVAGTSASMGIVPLGTGNMLARNLRIPTHNMDEAINIALGGDDVQIDVGDLEYVNTEGSIKHDVFLVMAGAGFDAEIMKETSEGLKSIIGPAAYTVTGLQRLGSARSSVSITSDERTFKRHIKTMIVGNCGELPGKVALMPDANMTDGKLDGVVISAKGVAGWARVLWQVARKRRESTDAYESIISSKFGLSCKDPMPGQIDGDGIGDVTSMKFTVRRQALAIRISSEQEPVESVLDEQRTAQNAERARSGKIDLRPYDGSKES